MISRKVTKPRWRQQKWFYPALAAVGVVLVLGSLEATNVTHFIHSAPQPAQPSGPTPAQKKQEAENDAKQKQQAIENPVQATTPTSETVSGTAISLTAREESNGTVTVLTNLGSIPDGSCKLTITNGSSSTTQTATVIYQPEYSTCAGFSVPVSSAGKGTWSLTLDVTSRGATVSKTISVEVT